MTPTPEQLRELISYNEATGEMTWLPRTDADIPNASARNGWNSRFAGRPAFSHLTPHGYLSGGVMGKTFQAHRVAWAIYYGEWPKRNIDHVNGVKTDNRIDNLRDVSQVVNARNSKLRVNNKSGVTGIHWCSRAEKWRARVNVGGRTRDVGLFLKFEDAVLARADAKKAIGYGPTYEGL